ncbi:uncharacterized protein LOC129618344 [Condylostylus longicornis]|uniref:uncharacterized protein LOC129618344 n=1 Tax=Condylostylus longicornis TaxID=2530218 RepID=UPI00244DCE89|nr:uncharacterized protein LOC129618344 [Condylostylus longicornis]
MDSVFQRIQPSEYCKRFLEFQIRPDGRHLGEVRDVRVMKNVLKESPSVIGSSIVSAGHSRFLAAVTAEIAPPVLSAPKAGKIVVNLEFPKTCGALDVNRDAGEDIASLAAQTSVSLCHIFSSQEVIDLKQFCVKEGNAVWVLYVNIICLEYDGNATDWSICSAAAALEDSVLPAIVWDPKHQWWRISDDNDESDNKDELETQKTENTFWESRRVVLTARPLSVTLAKLLETYWIVDPSMDETQLGELITIWRATKADPTDATSNQLHFLRPGGSALEVQRLLHSLFEVSHNGMVAMQTAIDNAVKKEGVDMWEVCCSDGDTD